MIRIASRERRSRLALAWTAFLCLFISACGAHGLAFREDRRVDILEPGDRELVQLPVTVRWSATDVDIGPKAGSYGVLVDRTPPAPGKTLEWLFRGRDECAGRPGCPSEERMAQGGVSRTIGSEFTIEHLNRPQNTIGREFHEVTIILLDDNGERSGESAWHVEFEVDRG